MPRTESRLVDLTMRVRPRWRFQSELTPLSSLENGDHSAATRITLGSHTFTHVDAPSHMIKGGLTLDRVPLDRFWGQAAVVDLQDMPDDHPITAEVLKMRGEHVKRGDIALFCSALDVRHAIDAREYWLHSPWLDRSAAEWLRDRRVKAVGYDFPQDQVIRRLPEPALKPIDFPVHQVLLGADIVQVEYLVNLTSVT